MRGWKRENEVRLNVLRAREDHKPNAEVSDDKWVGEGKDGGRESANVHIYFIADNASKYRIRHLFSPSPWNCPTNLNKVILIFKNKS